VQQSEGLKKQRLAAPGTRTIVSRVNNRLRFLPAFAIVALCTGASRSANAQTQYRNLDAGRPGRVEDAEPEARYGLDIDLAAFQVERLVGGTMRYRAEPKLAYGILPFTELELRAPVLQITPPDASGGQSVAGMAGLSVGVLHALNLETTTIPALALAGEFLIPVGNLAPTRGAYMMKGVVTKTTSIGRFHANAGYGTWTIRPPSNRADASCGAFVLLAPGDTACGVSNPPVIFDLPCTKLPNVPGRLANLRAQMCQPPPTDSAPSQVPTLGNRWFVGAAFDRSFPFRSLLVSGDLFAERLIGLYPIVDWTGELGLRFQLSPVMVTHVGVARHFAGVVRSTSLSIGATYELATPPLLGR
jgi:hypothetical protein